MNKNGKVLVIGLDGATLDLIKPWAAEGKLPTFKKLMDEGIHGVLRSTIPNVTIPAWPSFATGVNPGKHGLFDFFRQAEGTYDPKVEQEPSRAIKVPTLWQILSDHGKPIGVVNVPATFPPTKVNGYMVTGLLTPSGHKFIYPPEFETELVEKIGSYHVLSPPNIWKASPQMLLSDLKEALQERLKVTLHLIDKSIDFLMVVDNGTDRAGHEFWWCVDHTSPIFTSAKLTRCGNLLLQYYQEVDRALETIMGKARRRDTVIIMSDHGMGPVRKFISLNTFLLQQGVIQIKKNILSKLRYILFNNGWNLNSLDRLLRALRIQQHIGRAFSDQTKSSLSERLFFSSRDIDWLRTKAYALEAPGGIRINLKGREAQGIVGPGKEYQRVIEDLVEKLRSATDPLSGDKFVREVFRREEIYHGPYVDKAPDIVAIPNDSYEFFRAYRFPFSGVLQTTSGHSGAHRPNGVVMAVGEGIKKGVEITGANIVDIAPTILHIMNVPVPTIMDGRVLKEIFEPKSELARKQVEYEEINYEKDRIRGMVAKLRYGGSL